jgi:hypothetical protein
MSPDEARARAETAFKKEQQAREGAKAWLEYQAEARATQEKTARLRALRLAKEAAVPYFHVVFSLPAQIADIAYQNKAVIYDILFKASAEAMTTIAADPKHLGAQIGILSVLHTWGSALNQNPHSGYQALSSP